ncbi:MAG: thioredoxin-disulfide reductase [Nitrospirota bacterium]
MRYTHTESSDYKSFSNMTGKYDVVIIGGGPAGLTAGLYTSRAMMKSLLIEKGIPGGQMATTYRIENYPGFDEGISGLELSQRMERQARKFGLEFSSGRVEEIRLDDNEKVLITDDGLEIRTKALIIATGVEPKSLKVDGEERFRGRGVSYCATCDGAFFRDKKIAVIGGGDSALEEALFLTRFAEEIFIIHRRDKLRATRILQERAFEESKIKFIWDSFVEKIEGDDTVNKIVIRNLKNDKTEFFSVSGVFIYIGSNSNTEFLRGLVNLDSNGFIITDEKMATSVPGIYAAGDVRTKTLKQIATAVGDGAIAAKSAEKYIEDK